MGTTKPTPIPFPVSSFPGENPQESAGRLINCSAEPLGDPQKPTGPTAQKWRRQPGLSQHAVTQQSGYRGGLIVINESYEVWLNEAATVDVNGTVTLLGPFPGSKKVSIARNQAANPDVLAVDVDNGAYILNTSVLVSATATVTIAGATFTAGDTVSLTFLNFSIQGFPVTVFYTVVGGNTATDVATGLTALINANTTLAGAFLTALSSAGVITVSQQGNIANSTQITSAITGTGSETVAFSPTNGILAGGTGTPGITFTGTPLAYSVGGGPQPNSVCFQDGYFFLTSANGHVAATALNSLSVNGLTFITVQAKADVALLRGVAFSGLLLLFTTGSCEIWQDAANAAPAFPYARMLVLEFGLIQSAAIAGWETGFSELLWVAQDYGVYWMTPGSVASPTKVSPPDLDRLIEAQVKAGNLLDAGCYVFAGKKFWHLSSPAWSWEFNISTQKWNERQSFATSMPQGRWRATGGHPAFNKWLVGDTLTGNLLFIDDQNYTENGAPQLFRIESGPVMDFPNQIRIARADFNFDMGVGIAVGNLQMTITGAVSGNGGVVRLTVNATTQVALNDTIQVSGVLGTTEANGVFPATVIDATHLELQGSVFVNAYSGGGVAVDLTSPPSAIHPVCAISVSHNGGLNWGNPLIRQLGVQGRSKRQRASVKNMGLSGPMGDRWRVDVTDPVYTALLGGTQSSDPREIGA
jgi:hypothetical protein